MKTILWPVAHRPLFVRSLFTLSLSALILFSCSPQKRLQRLLHRHPELSKTDTVWRKDSFRIPGVKADTAFRFQTGNDTIVLDKGRLVMKYFYSHDTVYLSGNCRDSIIVSNIP